MSTIHLKNWVDWSNPDYYTMFVKAWIPFNAWFMDSFYDERTRRRDRDIIDYIKDNPNKFRDKIVNLLAGSGVESQLFYSHLDGLDRELEAHTLKNRGERVSFSNMRLSSNPVSVRNEEHGAYKYKCEKITSAGTLSWRCQIMKRSDSSTICQFSLPKWDLTSFHDNPDFLALRTAVLKRNLEDCFLKIDPRPVAKIVLSIVSRGGREKAPLRSLTISDARKRYFTDDKILVSKALVEILYSLRCMIFHGSLDPTGSNQGVYEHAFYIMNILIKELV